MTHLQNSYYHRMDEFNRIATYFAPLAAKAEGAFGLTDDAAVVTIPAGEQLVVTQDTLLEGVHFLGAEPPERLAQKALRVNLSDLAAKGATPLGYFLSLSLPPRCDDAWVAAFCTGLAEDQQRYGITLMGGDSTASPHGISITINAHGTTPRIVRRRGAQAGDILFVTGTIGDAALGLQVAQGALAHDTNLLDRYHLPQPRVAFARAIRDYATAALDVSDGLLQDATHLARQSALMLTIALDALPLSDATIAHAPDADALLRLATGGDDYEILFTAPAIHRDALQRAAGMAGVRLTAIGDCTEGQNINVSHAGNAVLLPSRLGYNHHQ